MVGIKFIDDLFDNAGNKIIILNKILFVVAIMVNAVGLLVASICGLCASGFGVFLVILILGAIVCGVGLVVLYIILMNAMLIASVANDTNKIAPLVATLTNKVNAPSAE